MDALFLFTTLPLLIGTGTGALTPEAYWKVAFPNTPISDAIRAFLPSRELSELVREYKHLAIYSGDISFTRRPYYRLWADMLHSHEPKPSVVHNHSQYLPSDVSPLFFMEKDLKPGSKVNLTMTSPAKRGRNSSTGPTLLPYEEAQAIPFSTPNLTAILNMFSIVPDSHQASFVRQTLHDCGMRAIKREDKYCATSLESMIDFAISELGTSDIHVLATFEINKENKVQQRAYRVSGDGSDMKSLNVVTCHNMMYPYAVFYCHKLAGTRAYMIPLVADDGSQVNAAAVCHFDTSNWNPEHVSFQMLRVKPGTVPVCHFLLESFAWVPS